MRSLSCILLLLLCVFGADTAFAGEADISTCRRNKALNSAFSGLALRLRKGVVDMRDENDVRAASGILIENGSYIVTAASLIRKNVEYTVVSWNGRRASATVLGRDELNDVALLKLEGDLPDTVTFDLENRAALEVGSWVVSVGITSEPEAVGTVSALNRRIRRFEIPLLAFGLYGLFDEANRGMPRSWPKVIQHDGPLAADKLGTALVDSSGRLAGINVSAPFRGSSLAVPVNVITGSLPVLKEGKDVRAEGFLGVRVVSLSRRERKEMDIGRAVKVREARAGTPAEKAGMETGDIILEIDGEKVSSSSHFAEIVKYLEVGHVATVKLQRGKRKRMLRVEVIKRSRS
ncbi:MAG: S1C family serine protease [Planctomycetota bacterium]|jgi:serine protease Do